MHNRSENSLGAEDKDGKSLGTFKDDQLVSHRGPIKGSLDRKGGVDVRVINHGKVRLITSAAGLALKATRIRLARSISGKGVFHNREGIPRNHHAHDEGLGSLWVAPRILIGVSKL